MNEMNSHETVNFMVIAFTEKFKFPREEEHITMARCARLHKVKRLNLTIRNILSTVNIWMDDLKINSILVDELKCG